MDQIGERLADMESISDSIWGEAGGGGDVFVCPLGRSTSCRDLLVKSSCSVCPCNTGTTVARKRSFNFAFAARNNVL